jgi:hypothetical protein
MSIQNFIVRERDGLWEVRLGTRLLSGQPTRQIALSVAEALAQTAALRGESSKILIATIDGVAVEVPVATTSPFPRSSSIVQS